MSENEPLIIVLGIIGLPILAVLYFLMPKDTHCNYCKSPLSMHRQKTYHIKLNGQEKEVCKRCYGK
ncbi:hypothetical protein [Cellvibrio zantedeschiae]|uniref:hypothetical protein n=1 Tax=Cellvibrio zantedeschiae TaxID=1237077 RepID=UPI0016753FAC|nr:hypothetical protein [Cellvibrio zantedeschiae]